MVASRLVLLGCIAVAACGEDELAGPWDQLPLDGNPRSMDLGLLYQALKQKQVEMVAGNSTDGLIAAMGLKMLRDDKSYFPPYDAALITRPELREALAPLSGRITTGQMRHLNHQVDGEHRRIPEVARNFLDGH